MKAPEQIFASKQSVEAPTSCVISFTEPSDEYSVQYTRADVAQAQVAAAYETVVNSADTLGHHCVGCGHLAGNPDKDLEIIKKSGDRSCCPERTMEPLSATLRAISPTTADARAALDRIVQEAVREALERAANVAEGVALPMDGKNAKAQADYMRGVIASSIRAMKGGEA